MNSDLNLNGALTITPVSNGYILRNTLGTHYVDAIYPTRRRLNKAVLKALDAHEAAVEQAQRVKAELEGLKAP